MGASVYFVGFPQLVLSRAAGAEVAGSLIIDFHEGNLRIWAFELERALSSTQAKIWLSQRGVLPPSKNAGWHSAFALPSQMLKGESKTNQNQHAVLCSDYLKTKMFLKSVFPSSLCRKSVLLNTKSEDPETSYTRASIPILIRTKLLYLFTSYHVLCKYMLAGWGYKVVSSYKELFQQALCKSYI